MDTDRRHCVGITDKRAMLTSVKYLLFGWKYSSAEPMEMRTIEIRSRCIRYACKKKPLPRQRFFK